jgi:hypothetical protein
LWGRASATIPTSVKRFWESPQCKPQSIQEIKEIEPWNRPLSQPLHSTPIKNQQFIIPYHNTSILMESVPADPIFKKAVYAFFVWEELLRKL